MALRFEANDERVILALVVDSRLGRRVIRTSVKLTEVVVIPQLASPAAQ
ncbi:MAG: hypothetical protein R3F39_00880 [Myxococcota bacterium]